MAEAAQNIKVGIDLDHTILAVDEALEKSEVLFGFKAFVMEHRDSGSHLIIVAHGAGEAESVTQHLEAKQFFAGMDKGGLGFSKEDLIFVDSEEEKVKKINELGMTHFIDDSVETFQHGDLADHVQPLVFGQKEDAAYPTFAEWSDLTNFFYWQQGVRDQTQSRITSVKGLKEHGDNYIYQVSCADGSQYILKHFLESSENAEERLAGEVKHLNALHQVGITKVPKSFWHRGCWGLFNHIEGSHVDEPNDQDVGQLIDFLIALDQKSDALRAQQVDRAPKARFRLHLYADKLNTLWNQVLSACQRPDGPKDIMLFMMTDMEQLRQDNLNHFYLWLKREKWEKEQEISEKEAIFSPSDFGFHNTIKAADGTLSFLDFEESGWDDPAKLLADFFYNTEQNLTMENKLKVLDAFVKQREWDENFLKRFWAVSDLIAVEWILNHLSVVIPDVMRRLQYANPGLDPKQVVKQHFQAAIQMRERFQPMEHLCKHDQLIDQEGEIETSG
ncbi:phosphotransferase [Acanthopleuribacter pedis]|uniref:Aminoglycoside phosphotransferase domain-containing protein n=1 Tax=Acanthopleuribacter pedis TaxID=442870 RepID=A0A8J7U0F6_9BACT|nr:phosphotransferase [Acanthopleuribacter pedis]MBO1317013.1 hypothetical protein [Acanthopleuribacter pedis]